MFEVILMKNAQAGCIIIAIAVLSALLGNKLSIKTRFFLWFVPIIRLIAPSLPTVKFSLFQHSGQLADQVFVGSAPMETVLSSQGSVMQTQTASIPSMLEVLSLVWIVGATVLLGHMLLTNLVFYWNIRRCKTIGQIGTSSLIQSPITVGLIRPKILLPMHHNFDREQLMMVLEHEKAHIKRKDIWLFFCLHILCCVFWFNPLVWYLSKRMRQDAELLCDGLVLKQINEEQQYRYGLLMLELLRNGSKTPRLGTAAGIVGRKAHMKNRIKMIAGFQKKSYRVGAIGIVLLLLTGCVSLTDHEIKSPSLLKTPDFVSEKKLTYTYSVQGMEYADKLLTSKEKGKVDLFQLLKLFNISYQVTNGEIVINNEIRLSRHEKDQNVLYYKLPQGLGEIKIQLAPQDNAAYVDELELVALLKSVQDDLPYTVTIDEQQKKISVDQPSVSYYQNAITLDITYELGDVIQLIYDKERSVITIGEYTQEVNKGITDGQITVSEQGEITVTLWDGKEVTTISLNRSDVGI